MNDIITTFKLDLHKLIDDLQSKKIIGDLKKDNISIDFASKSKQGDLSSNIFILLLKSLLNKDFPLKEYLKKFFINLEYVKNIDIPKVGFVNIFFNRDFILLNLKNIVNNRYRNQYRLINRKKINVEFVSANPTGPIHLAHIRGAVLGDVLSSILIKVGHQVTREYYVNDAGSQIQILGASLFKRYQQLFNIDIKLLEGEYPGNYLIEIANLIKNDDGDKWILCKDLIKKNRYFESFAVNYLINNIKDDLSLINIKFDKFTFESQVVKEDYINKILSLLNKKNLIYEGMLGRPLGEEDNKNWEPRKQLLFRSTNFSDDSDRAFKKINGEWTYFANDAAYHYYKYLRGYDKLINIWGADHIGYVSRMKSIVDATSGKIDFLKVCICQIVRLIKDNKFLKMSKRDDNFITLKQMYNAVGKDPLRYFMISSKSETPMDFDMNKVIEKNKDNPVFYCQYAYARASSVLRKASKIKNIPEIKSSFDSFDISIVSNYEWQIILKILFWPYVLIQASESMQPHRITNYLEDLCSHFHSFWNKGKDDVSLRMIDETDINKTITKLIWIYAFKLILNDIFKIIDIDSPDIM